MANSAENVQLWQRAKGGLFEFVSLGDVEKTKTILHSHSEVDINHTVDSKGRNLLHVACEHGHINMVRCLVSLGADVNLSGFYYTPLFIAVLNNHTSIVSALVSEFGCDPNDGESLHTACKHGNLSMVKTLIECGASIYSRDAYGNTPLHATARNERKETTQALLNYLTGDPNIKNVERRTPLHIACVCGNLDGVKLLIKHGARVNVKDIHDSTPLSLAVLHNHTSIVSALVSEFGCDPNDGESLHTACKHGNLSMVKTLIECGASIYSRDAYGNTPLHATARNERKETTQALLNYLTGDPNIKNVERTPLHIACVCGNLDGVKLLIKHGARVNVKDIHDSTPLSLAVLNNHTSIVSALVSEFGCDPNDGVSLHTACKHGNLNMAKTLLDHGASVNDNSVDVDGNTPLDLAAKSETMQALFKDIDNIKNKDGRTPLHIACVCGNLGRIKLLIKHGARVNVKDIRDSTPLSLAVLHNHTSIVSTLMSEFGCDPNDGVSLHTACVHGNLSMVKTLIERGANVNGRDAHGNTPLHMTARYERKKTMQALLNYLTCDPNIKNKEGRSPLHVACICGNLDGVKLLIKHGARVNVKDIHDSTPLSLAVLNNHTSIVSALVSEFGCDPNDGVSLHTACKHDNLSMVKTLLEHGASVNDNSVDVDGNTPLDLAAKSETMQALFKDIDDIKNKDGRTPLHIACVCGNLGRIKLLIKHGARVNVKDIRDSTPLSLAVLHNHISIVSALVSEFGCDPNDGLSLHTACEHGNMTIVKTLMEVGANVNDKDVDGNTPLHLSARNKKNETMQTLLRDFKSDLNIKNKEGRTPLHNACVCGNLGGVKLLIKHGARVNACQGYSGQHTFITGCTTQPNQHCINTGE